MKLFLKFRAARVYFLNNHKIAHKKWIPLIFHSMKSDMFNFHESYYALFGSQYSLNTDRKSMEAYPNRQKCQSSPDKFSIGNWRTLRFIARSIAALKAHSFSFNWQQRAEKSDVYVRMYSHLAGNLPLLIQFLIISLSGHKTYFYQ